MSVSLLRHNSNYGADSQGREVSLGDCVRQTLMVQMLPAVAEIWSQTFWNTSVSKVGRKDGQTELTWVAGYMPR